ncbi:50S ribosomal protein L11 methyltransferase [Roseivirga pacifica]|uniref:50S ribosomal protein L11 methyltransferase n=1 Tax=Roseivirga pacifica TaxID=1267423 RepID=UPI0020953211|nr:50S ribosomal protein L11 methyltransferase [Roseivirga pacifica]MCO6358951.1 50S ribosomal protein L11 methyltransferase [Roseivirga pacifica]MCO6365413.1 50S ribosomal protein L11 methyltransferase [Roseivirga pacifica]MCO6371857.1 50S ribosomal protein L11 methyltransferase [Roseivirga pacifica]MCO6376032.1 50S ribosomal protein L11 methyltransferase [Roseivirga pacifica]MCO6379235.1 50S ribosomal protein L11 methyltransferase [Roseivirga pacifica]
MDYILINVHCDEPFSEILIAEMGLLDFDSFVETEAGFEAYINEAVFSHPAVQTLFNRYRKQTRIWYELKKVPKVNWNEEWEKNYDPIEVGDQVYIRATFHAPKPEVPYDIVINPKMSFGTGHHATTHQMVALQMGIDHQDKDVIDIGAGTGILAIMADKLGAKSVAATDIDDWCIENAEENFGLNNITPAFVKQGVIADLKLTETYDIVLANINTNILLEEMEHYVNLMRDEAYLLLSGFYTFDQEQILEKAESLGLKKVKDSERNKWAALVLQKS